MEPYAVAITVISSLVLFGSYLNFRGIIAIKR